MHFAYSEEQELLRDTTRRFLRDRHPVAAVRELLEAPDTFDRDVWRAGAELGWTAMLVPERYDGGSVTKQPLVDLAALAEELGRELYPGPLLATNIIADVVVRIGTDAQRKRYLPAIARGEVATAWCVSGDGTVDPDAVDVTMRECGKDSWSLAGIARFVPGASTADVLLVTVRSEAGRGLVLVPRSADGVGTRVVRAMDLTRRWSEVAFDAVTVSHDEVVVAPGTAEPEIARALQLATLVQAAEVVGAGEALFERTVQYAKDRVQFGRPIGSFQALKHRLADLLIELEAARAAARYAALALADDRDDRDEAVAVAGAYVRDAIAHLCGESVQLHGGIGFTWEHDVHLYLRRVKSEQVLYGESWRHRERLCAIAEATAEPA